MSITSFKVSLHLQRHWQTLSSSCTGCWWAPPPSSSLPPTSCPWSLWSQCWCLNWPLVGTPGLVSGTSSSGYLSQEAADQSGWWGLAETWEGSADQCFSPFWLQHSNMWVCIGLLSPMVWLGRDWANCWTQNPVRFSSQRQTAGTPPLNIKVVHPVYPI